MWNMDQKKAVEILGEVYDACTKILPKPIHDAYLHGDYATGRINVESSVDILIVIDMTWEELRPYEREVIHFGSELDMKYDVYVSIYLTPLSSFERNAGYAIYGDVRNDGIRYGASDDEIAAVVERARVKKENAMKQEEALEILGEVYTAYSKILPRTICDAFLYGSYARGDYHEESDVDIFITVDMSQEELKPYKDAMSTVDSDLGLKHDIMVSVMVTPLTRFEEYAEVLPLYRNIIAEGIRYVG